MSIRGVIHLKKSKRFLDEALPILMEAIRASRPDAALPHAELETPQQKNEKYKDEVHTPLVADDHVVSIYW